MNVGHNGSIDDTVGNNENEASGDRNKPKILHESYRVSNSPEFEYFMTKLLHRIGVNRIQFEKKKTTKALRNIYTVQDEAFGLLVLSNEYNNWIKQKEMKAEGKKGNTLRMKKRFVDGDSGRIIGWSHVGINLFYELCQEIKILRQSEESVKIECYDVMKTHRM